MSRRTPFFFSSLGPRRRVFWAPAKPQDGSSISPSTFCSSAFLFFFFCGPHFPWTGGTPDPLQHKAIRFHTYDVRGKRWGGLSIITSIMIHPVRLWAFLITAYGTGIAKEVPGIFLPHTLPPPFREGAQNFLSSFER